MKWNEPDFEDVTKQGGSPRVRWDMVRDIATRAVELKATRSGTMTEEELASATAEIARWLDKGDTPWARAAFKRMTEHITVLGARVAVLEQERDEWRTKWEGATQNEAMALELASTREQELDAALKRVKELEMRLFALEHNITGHQRREHAALDALTKAGVPVMVELKPGISSSFMDDRIRALARERDEAVGRLSNAAPQATEPSAP